MSQPFFFFDFYFIEHTFYFSMTVNSVRPLGAQHSKPLWAHQLVNRGRRRTKYQYRGAERHFVRWRRRNTSYVPLGAFFLGHLILDGRQTFLQVGPGVRRPLLLAHRPAGRSDSCGTVPEQRDDDFGQLRRRPTPAIHSRARPTTI